MLVSYGAGCAIRKIIRRSEGFPVSLSRIKFRGRKQTKPFVMLDREMLRSEQWARLSPHGMKLIIDLAAQYYGTNNGDLCATWSIMRKRGWRSPATLSRALHELIFAGWLVLSRQGGRHKSSLYALTIWGINDCGGKLDIAANRVPSHRWKINLGGPEVSQSSPSTYQSAPTPINRS